MPEQSFEIVGDDFVYTYRVAVPRALHCLRERSKASGGDGSDEEALEVLREKCGGEWQDDLDCVNQWDSADLASFLMGDALDACLPDGGDGFSFLSVEALWTATREAAERLHGKFGRSDAAEALIMNAVEAALREDGAETLRLVGAAMAEWRALS